MHPSYRTLALIVAAALFMENLDGTIIATALPAIARDFGVAPLSLNLAITAYLLSLCIFIPISGWAADRFGARRVFSGAIVVFMAGSVACAAANGPETLVMARILQGMGGAMMVPVGRLVILRAVPKGELIKALTWLTIPALLGPVMGPPIGGFIVTFHDWRWIFLINIPVGILGLFLAHGYIPHIRAEGVAKLDGIGFMLTACGLAALVFTFEAVGRSSLAPLTLVFIALFGVAALLGYAFHARRHPAPLVNLTLLKVSTYRLAILGGSLFRIGIGALPILLPLLLQLGFGMSAFASGLITFASAAGALVMKGATQLVLKAFGFRRVLIVNGILSGVIMMGYALFQPGLPQTIIFTALLFGGMLRSLQFTALNALSYADIGDSAMSSASTFSAMMQQLALSLGAGTAAFTLHMTLATRGHAGLQAGDFQPAYLIVGGLVILSALMFLRLPRAAGANVSGNLSATPKAEVTVQAGTVIDGKAR